MSKITGIIKQFVQSQEFGNDSEFVEATFTFDVTVKDKLYSGLKVFAKLTVGGQYNNHPMEVYFPPDYKEPDINCPEFHQIIENCYRSQIVMLGDSSNIIMQNNTFIINKPFEINSKNDLVSGW